MYVLMWSPGPTADTRDYVRDNVYLSESSPCYNIFLSELPSISTIFSVRIMLSESHVLHVRSMSELCYQSPLYCMSDPCQNYVGSLQWDPLWQLNYYFNFAFILLHLEDCAFTKLHSHLLVNFPDEWFEWVEVWSFYGIFCPTALDHVGQIFTTVIIIHVVQGGTEIRTLTILHFSVDLCNIHPQHMKTQ